MISSTNCIAVYALERASEPGVLVRTTGEAVLTSGVPNFPNCDWFAYKHELERVREFLLAVETGTELRVCCVAGTPAETWRKGDGSKWELLQTVGGTRHA